MKFGKFIASNQIPGWSSQYLDYKALKKIINSMAKRRPKDAFNLSIGVKPPFNNAIEDVPIEEYRSAFFFKLERELEKINAFYLAKESEIKIRIDILIDKKRSVITINNKQSNEIAINEGFQNLERQLVALQDYVEINATGFRKILKKWDKRSKSNTKELYLSRQVEVQPCFNTDVLSELSNVVATNLIDLENLKNSYNDHDHDHDPMSIDSSLETNSDIENIIIKFLKSNNNDGLIKLFQSNKSLKLTWESLAYAITDEQFDIITNQAIIEWNYVDDINNRNCLHKAAIVGNYSLYKSALDHNIDARRTDIYGRNPAHYAALNGHSKILEHLISLQIIELNIADLDGYTASLYTIVNGHDHCLSLLVSNLSSPPGSNLHPLCLAAQYGHESIVKILLKISNGVDIGPNAEGLYPQHLAARAGHANICKLLADEGGELKGGLHLEDKYSNWTPLFHAADKGHLNCLKVLLEANCDINTLDENKTSAIFYAAWNGHLDCVDALIEAKESNEIKYENEINSNVDLDNDHHDLDEIPSLALPPPMMPLRIYGHNYLLNRSLIQITLDSTPIKLNTDENEFKWSSLKLIVIQKPDLLNAPHHVILPNGKENVENSSSSFTFQVESFDKLSLEFNLYPGFGSVVMGKAFALPQTLSEFKDSNQILPIIDNKLNTIGTIKFNVSLIKPFEILQEKSTNVNAYWKSTTSVNVNKISKGVNGNVKHDSPTLTPNEDHGDDLQTSATVITSSSLPSKFIRWNVGSTKDFKCVVYKDPILKFKGLEATNGFKIQDMKFEDIINLANLNQMDTQHLSDKATLSSLGSMFNTLPDGSHVLLDLTYENDDCININEYVDDILSLTYDTTSSSPRNIAFVTDCMELATCVQWKQPHFPVFLKLSKDKSVNDSIGFIKSNNLLGLFIDHNLLQRVPDLIQAIKEAGVMIIAYSNNQLQLNKPILNGVDGLLDYDQFYCYTNVSQ